MGDLDGNPVGDIDGLILLEGFIVELIEGLPDFDGASVG